MTETNRSTPTTEWTSVQAYTLSVLCLLIGVVVGWLVRGSQAPAVASPATTSQAAPDPRSDGSSQTPTPEQLQHMADVQAAPMIERLKTNPNDINLLAGIGNIYYDAHLFPSAIDYYQRALKLEPANASVRTDMATAYWYTGNSDSAITELKKSLSYEPNQPNALFNLGIVEWQGKMDVKSAVEAWQKLLDTNPNYEGKDKVLQLMAEAKKHAGVKPGTPAKPLPQ
ncbi:MAG: tetratricopeptide repeat protein [Candidatus Sulfotelmatobacter sp.]